jgi:mono/diheme cytochrome c family protein
MNRVLIIISTISTIVTALFAFDEAFAIHQIEAKKREESGKKLYLNHCARCHHSDRIGVSAPPLLPMTLRKYEIKELISLIRDGFEQTLMPKFTNLSTSELVAISRFIKSPTDLKSYDWGKKEIENSLVEFNSKKRPLPIKDIKNVTPVVERGANRVWIMEDDEVLDRFPLSNVHGGIKYQFPEAQNIFIPTRDGYVEKYSLKDGKRVAKERMCIYLRNVSISRDGKSGFTTCLLPEQMVVFDTENLKPLKISKLKGKVSALYELYTEDKMVFTYRDKALVGFVDTKSFNVEYKSVDEPIEDFFIDPFDRYIIATARRGKLLRVYDIESMKVVFEHKMGGMPHLFSATYWYRDGKFYFATPHLKSNFITVWQMYEWKLIKQIPIGGDGFFVKTHPATPYLWVDNGSDELVLVDKKDYSIKKLVPEKGKQYIHTEFSGDGRYTYLSIYDRDGSILVWETKSFKELKEYPANIPVGKYNFICKNRRFYPILFGEEIVKERFKGSSKEQLAEKLSIGNLKNLGEYELKALKAWLGQR